MEPTFNVDARTEKGGAAFAAITFHHYPHDLRSAIYIYKLWVPLLLHTHTTHICGICAAWMDWIAACRINHATEHQMYYIAGAKLGAPFGADPKTMRTLTHTASCTRFHSSYCPHTCVRLDHEFYRHILYFTWQNSYIMRGERNDKRIYY